MNRRIDERVALDPTDFGGQPEERELIARLFTTKEDVPKNAISIDATAPLARVVDDILSECREADEGATSGLRPNGIAEVCSGWKAAFLSSPSHEGE